MNTRFKLYADLLLIRIRTNFFLVKISAFTVSCSSVMIIVYLEFNSFLIGYTKGS